MAGTTWQVHRVRFHATAPRRPSPLLEGWWDLEERERALGIGDGQWFLLRPDGSADVDVLRYCNSPAFRLLAAATQQSYAVDLKVHLSFLSSQGRDWRAATEEDVLDYEFWRRRDERNPRRIGGAKFARELAACRRFYDWQVAQGVLEQSPIRLRAWARLDGTPMTRPALGPSNVRSSRVKWLTPRAYRRWRDVGLGGYAADGTRDGRWRGRNDGRNVAFADTVWSSGLRLREAATLLTWELPAVVGEARFVRARVAAATAKGAGRDFWVSTRALQRVDAYVRTGRRAAIRRAQHEGRYDELTGVVVARSLTGRGELVGVDEAGVEVRLPLDALDAEARRRVFVAGEEGLEPAALWLTEAGMPMPPATWEMVFATANERCARLGVALRCHPHMLRHSFALRMLVTLVHAFDRRMGLSPQERRDYRLLFGDPWVLVQTMLGHRSSQTTREVYLEPVQGLQVELFLNGEDRDDAPVAAVLAGIAAASSRVADEEG